MHRHELTAAALILVAAALLLVTGCESVMSSLSEKSVNTGIGTDGALISATPSPQNGGNALSFLAGSTYGVWQTVPSIKDGSPRNTCLVQRTESSAWYCASVKKTTVAITITSDSPIALDWGALMTATAAQPGEQLSQTAKTAAAIAPVVAGAVAK